MSKRTDERPTSQPHRLSGGTPPLENASGFNADRTAADAAVLNVESHRFGPRIQSVDPLCRVVLIEPLIPENTGNISRTCVGTKSELHLVEPMGFEITEARVKRAGLDYWADLSWQTHESAQAWSASVPDFSQIFFIETGGDKTIYDVEFRRGDWLVFGKETSGLDSAFLRAHDAAAKGRIVSIPMPGSTRSLNLSNAVAVAVFELLRQTTQKVSQPLA